MRRRLISLVLLLASAVLSAQQPAPARPRLIVILVVDQMRTDYLERAPHFTAGLKRLTGDGAWFTEGAYPYLNTVTCAGHSTIGTGALPYNHGMVLNAWLDRSIGRERACTSDETAQNIAYSTATLTGGDSARWLLVPPLGQKVREAGGRTVAMSLKPRSAIPLAGSNPTAVIWLNDRAGWATSSAFSTTRIDWVEKYVAANPIAADGGKVWDRTLPPDKYAGLDDGLGERFPTGWTRTFPHPVSKAEAPEFMAQWQRSPFADEYLGRMAAAAVDAIDLGRGPSTDFLAVSFSSLDLVGHQFGPSSHEVQDLVLRLDRTIGALLDHLDSRLGRNGYVVGLSADHGVGPMPEQTEGSGRQSGSQAIAAIDGALVPIFGPGKYAAQAIYTDLYLLPGVLDRLKANPKASEAVLDALRALPGVARAYRADEISAPEVRTSSDPFKRAAALSYYAPRSGDLIIVPRQHWLFSTSSATTHGTLHPYDQRVPVIFYGAGVPGGRRSEAATPADIAPTLAALAGFTAYQAPDGKPLITAPVR
jgi:predicted AlkP superfamily pyrophosphatase or phosphodiesterase